MDVRFSAEQKALRDSAAQVADRLGPQAVGQLDDAERTAKLDAAVAASGWRELRTATDDGTPWATGVEVAIVAEELSRGLADTPFLGPTLAAELRRLSGAPPATSPETVLFHADLSTPVHVAAGEALPPGAIAVDAAGAPSALVLVAGRGGTELAQVALEPAVTQVDLTRAVSGPDPASVIEPVAEGAVTGDTALTALTGDDLTGWMALALAVTCADLVGTMRGATTLATEYAKDRRQYGQPVGAFQAVQHLLADAHVAAEGSRSAALHAAWAVDALPPNEALAAAALAKAYCARAARSVCETAIQVHGGIGNTWECLAHVHLRRALLATDVLGGVGANLTRVLEHHGIGGDRGLR